MQYRPFGKLDYQVSALGFGCMRLPTLDANNKIDEPEAIRMVRHAIDQGVNYIDTAYPYHGGESERLVAKVLKDGYRDRVKLATKLPVWEVKEPADFDRLLNEQLAKLEVETIDFYLLHALNADSWHKVRDMDVLAWAEGALADGRIQHLGFSFHDKHEVFIEIVDAYDKWDFCQIQYNYMDIEEQAGTKGLEYAASKGLAIVIMEPLLGGKLVNAPQPVQDLWSTAPVKRSPVGWALQWLWSNPHVSTILSGMSTMEQVEDNLVHADQSSVGLLTEPEYEVVAKVADLYRTLSPIPCTDCKYCMPCPNDVDIPRNFAVFNSGVMYDSVEDARRGYEWIKEEARASSCIQCGICEEKCPQSIPISDWMPLVDEVLGQGQDYDPTRNP